MEKISIDDFNDLLSEMPREDRRFLFFRYLLEHPNEYNKLNKELDDTKDLKKMRMLANKVRDSKDIDISIRTNIEYYLNRTIHYKRILQNGKKLAIELKLNNSLEVANLFTYLLWNGYFSKDQKLIYQNDGRYQIPGEYSHDIMSGKGVCLNFSYMLADFINEFKYSSCVLLNYLDTKKTKKLYVPPIKRKLGVESFEKVLSLHFFEPIQKISGNHAFNLIKEDQKLYIYDATGLSIFKIKDKNKASLINGRADSFLKPYISYSLNTSKKSINTLDFLHLSDNFIKLYNRLDFIYSWEKCDNLFKDNINLIIDFYYSILEDINYIADTNETAKKIVKEIK